MTDNERLLLERSRAVTREAIADWSLHHDRISRLIVRMAIEQLRRLEATYC